MAKNKKSKILAMALCASVMTGIYASPVMAEELYVDGTQSVTTNGVGKTKIASLEGLKEITLGDSVKITTDGKGIIRVGGAGGGNTRVFKDGFYVNTSGDDRKTSLKAGTLTLAGIDLTSEQLDIINDVITNDGAVVDVTSKAADGKTYSLNTVGKNTSGIRRAGTTDENRSTYIEETVRVNNNSGLVVYAEDGTTFAAQIDRKGNVLTKGVGRFGALEGPNVRMENGVLTVNSIGETDVAKLDAEGLTLTSDTTEATLSAEQIARLNTVVTQNGESIVVTADHFKNTNESFAVDSNGAVRAATVNGVAIGMNADGDITLGDDIVFDDKFNSGNVAGITRKPLAGGGNTTFIEQNTAISADGIVVTDPDSGVSTKTKYDGFYVKDKDSKILSSLKDDGLMLTNEQSGRQTLNATDIADIKGIDRSGNDTDGYKTTIEGATSFTNDGMVTSNITTDSFTAGVTADSSYGINATGEMLFRSGDNYIGMDRGRIGFTSGTESVTINGEGTTFTSDDSTTRTTTSTVIKGGTITTGTLKVEDIVLGNSMTDEDGNSLAIGAAGYINIKKDGETVFGANTENLTADYGDYSLSMDGSTGFALGNNVSSLTLTGSGYTFSGPVNLGAGSEVGFNYDDGTDSGKYITLDSLVDTVNDIYDRTQGISHNADGSTTIESGTRNPETGEFTSNGSKVTIGDNGATFENGENNGTTNINGSEIVSDATASSTVTGGAGAGTGTVNGGYAEFDKGEGGKTIVDGGNVNVSNKITVGTGTTEITGDHVIVGVHDANKSNIGKGEATFDKGEDGKTIVNGGNVTTGNITADTGKIGNVEFTADGTTFEDGSENQTVIDKNGIVVGANDGTKIDKDDVSINDKNGGRIHLSDMGQVDNIDAELKQNDNYDDTVVGGINAEADIRRTEVARLDDRITKVEDRVDKVGAMSAAIANLRTMGYDPAAPTEIAVGIGQYRSETGAALGLFHYPNKDFMLSLSVSTSGDEVMGGIGATWKFGRKSAEEVEAAEAKKAEKARIKKAEKMRKAAKEAKVKAQQERHAKMAAEMKK